MLDDGKCHQKLAFRFGCLNPFIQFSTVVKNSNFQTKQLAFVLEIFALVLSFYMLELIKEDQVESVRIVVENKKGTNKEDDQSIPEVV